MKRFLLLLVLAGMLVLVAGCATTSPLLPPGATIEKADHVNRWLGVWAEQWPNSSQSDRYRITLESPGGKIVVVPLTNAARQNLSEFTWDGKRLEFVNHVEERKIFYALEMDKNGDQLNGTVRSEKGDISNITWTKAAPDIVVASPRTLKEVRGKMDRTKPSAFAGNWQEDWPGNKENDAYRIRLDGDDISLEVLSNLEKQAIGRMEWNGKMLSFDMYYKEEPIKYELFLESEQRLIGVVTLPNGGVKRITWNRIGPAAIKSRVSAKTWSGKWKEFWPERGGHDFYRLTVTGKREIKVHAITNQARQSLAGVQFNGSTLSFQLRFGDNTIVYQLRLDDSATIRGTARIADGQSRNIVWFREK